MEQESEGKEGATELPNHHKTDVSGGAEHGTITPSRQAWPPPPTVLTLQDLADLPRQILPEQTYFHLQNAAREATFAVLSLVKTLNRARAGEKVRKRIEVE